MGLTAAQGGDGQWFNIEMMNDTGSDIMTFFDTDFAMLGDLSLYVPNWESVFITDANGLQQEMFRTRVEVQLIRDNGEAWGPIFLEWVVFRPYSFGMPRLTGLELRRNFFIGTGTDFSHLSIACTKGGMSSLL
jgi:hypothetical protein